MEYFVIYDNNDNLVCYIDSLEELSSFTGSLKKTLKFRFKNNDFIRVIVDKVILNVYKFC